MTELDQYKRAYATLVGRVDTAISRLKEGLSGGMAAEALADALQESEEIFLSGEPEEG